MGLRVRIPFEALMFALLSDISNLRSHTAWVKYSVSQRKNLGVLGQSAWYMEAPNKYKCPSSRFLYLLETNVWINLFNFTIEVFRKQLTAIPLSKKLPVLMEPPKSPPEDPLLSALPSALNLHSVSVTSPRLHFPGMLSSYISYGFLLSPQARHLILFLFNHFNSTMKTVSKLVLWPCISNNFTRIKAKLFAYRQDPWGTEVSGWIELIQFRNNIHVNIHIYQWNGLCI
jgi:hypothetical protein